MSIDVKRGHAQSEKRRAIAEKILNTLKNIRTLLPMSIESFWNEVVKRTGCEMRLNVFASTEKEGIDIEEGVTISIADLNMLFICREKPWSETNTTYAELYLRNAVIFTDRNADKEFIVYYTQPTNIEFPSTLPQIL
jgi:hypothetical protein